VGDPPQNTQVRRVRLEAMAEKDEPTQRTQPKKGKPIDIPVPKRNDFDKLLKRAEQAKKPKSR
jgi:hypothetical protein